MSSISSAPFSPEEIAAEGLKPEEYEDIVHRLGRHPNKAELGMFGVMWSEHCCYKNSRPLLKQFPTEGDRILVGPGENAGVVDLGDGLRLAFKIESHNHPSAVEPFQGAATGVGGILRDIFTMGARPIAVLNSLRFGSLEDARTRRLFSGVVEGISHYGNCVGVPTVGGEVYFDPAYSDNPLVNVMALGLMETPEIVKSGAAGIGNPVLYVGSTTGRDGMGGASFASAELSEQSMDDRPAVQVGDPFLEKSLIEACLEAFKTGAVVAAQDMGAAGITCSTSEMAAKGGVGIELDLDLIPVRESGMVPYEYLLSESQERMLFVAHKGREQELIDIFHRWGLQAVVAGTVIAEPIVRILFQGGVAAEIPATALADNTPIYHRELLAQPPEYARQAWEWTANSLPACTLEGIDIQGNHKTWSDILLQLLDTPTIASKRWVYRQYDHQVQNNTVMLPGGADAAVVRLRPLEVGIPNPKSAVAATVDCNSRYVYLDPYEGAKAVVAEAARNLSCVGAEPLAVTDNLNFGSPEKPIGYWQLASACQGIAEACRIMETPVTGGNVSLYNETLDATGTPQPIYPTPVIGMVGLIPDMTRVCRQGWQAEGDLIYLLGLPLTDSTPHVCLGGSEYLASIHGVVAGKPPVVDFDLERRVQAATREGIRQGWVRSAHDCAEGGIAVALAESCIASQLGAQINLRLTNIERRWDEVLYGESASRILVSVKPEHQARWESYLKEQWGEQTQHWQNLGFVKSQNAGLKLLIDDNQPIIDVTMIEMSERFSNALERRLNV
ncbi:phosphoribosylformylglycinamidine synthase subunit PurL [Allocoleopsis franciscana]|uniref:Phosphoribosylformylglycinamidine synthase subunit PurL n=1 Tax=Allocoleopsis franciscana PCC 7113 TaxID=1173027 RepID=K9WFU7_9CYAN|nr:phosphoribosylformylglycinamidine synthase subunit PurL [Allocoleopsis franciscana]AFZ18639.1 phosphoribosylformylglycinamidine synthase subunit II [Allocoleopsis franciscana PCC 7113]